MVVCWLGGLPRDAVPRCCAAGAGGGVSLGALVVCECSPSVLPGYPGNSWVPRQSLLGCVR